MDRYSKIKLVNSSSTKSRSIDFSDLQSFPLETKNPTQPQAINFKTQVPKTQINTNLQKLNDSSTNDEESDENNKTTNEGRFGMVKLSINRSVSVGNSSSHRFKIEKQSTNAVKRAFSMRRSSSVSEKYCRIYDQTVSVTSPLHDDDDDIQPTSIKNKKRYSSSRILKACKRLLGI